MKDYEIFVGLQVVVSHFIGAAASKLFNPLRQHFCGA